ncbi:MAG: hypothetical protein ACLR7U_12330 [Ruthenibacterium lactatiformans]
MVVTLDAIFNRVIRNWRQGKRTWILADEFTFVPLLFQCGIFLPSVQADAQIQCVHHGDIAERGRGLRSDTARLMLANSELLVMLNGRRRTGRSWQSC